MKINGLLIANIFLFVTSQTFAANMEPLITKSTTYVLQRANIPDSSYEIGMGVGQLSPNATKAWKLHTAPELAYLLAGQLTISMKNHGSKTMSAGQSYQTPTDISHQSKAGHEGYTYVVVWGKEKGKSVAKGRSDSEESRKEINLPLISQIAKHHTSLKNISSKLDVLETGHIPKSAYNISLVKGTLAPSDFIKPRHKYDSPQIFYVLNGELILTLKGYSPKKYIFGDSFEIPANVFYQIKAGHDGVAYLAVWVHRPSDSRVNRGNFTLSFSQNRT